MEPSTLVLLSYDVSTARRSAASRVAHLIFGRKDAPEGGPVPFVRRAGVVWIGQSVFLMPKATATELAEKLYALGAIVAMGRVSISPADIEALRRRTRPREAS
jgi:hypothetical protein